MGRTIALLTLTASVPPTLARLAAIRLTLLPAPRRAVIAQEGSISILAPVLATIARLASTLAQGPLRLAPIAVVQANIREGGRPFAWLQVPERNPIAGGRGSRTALLKRLASVPQTLVEHAQMARTLLLAPRPVVHAREESTMTPVPQLALTASPRSTLPPEFSRHALIATELASTVVLERHFV